jgi:hypothetical protein
MNLRPTNDQERFSLKVAFRMLLKLAGGQEAAENFTRGKHQTLNRYGNQNEPDCHAPIDVIVDLERVVGEPIVTKQLADMAGYLLVKKVEAASASDMLSHLVAVGKETGDVMTVLSDVASGGADCEEALRRLMKEAREGREAHAAVEEAARVRLEQIQGRSRVVNVRAA